MVLICRRRFSMAKTYSLQPLTHIACQGYSSFQRLTAGERLENLKLEHSQRKAISWIRSPSPFSHSSRQVFYETRASFLWHLLADFWALHCNFSHCSSILSPQQLTVGGLFFLFVAIFLTIYTVNWMCAGSSQVLNIWGSDSTMSDISKIGVSVIWMGLCRLGQAIFKSSSWSHSLQVQNWKHNSRNNKNRYRSRSKEPTCANALNMLKNKMPLGFWIYWNYLSRTFCFHYYHS